jgi:hypothetical protein
LTLLFAQAHIQHFNTIINQNVTCNFCCDGKSLLQRIQGALHRPCWVDSSQRLALDFNLKSGTLDIIVSLSVSFQHPHFRSRQDDDTKAHLPPWEAQMNAHADALATDCLDNHAEPSKVAPFIPASQVSLTINGKTIPQQHAKRFQQAASSPRTCQKLMARNDWSLNTFRSMNCDIPEKALETLENGAQVFIIKFAHDHLSACRHMHWIKRAETDKGPACEHVVETDWHSVLGCPKCSPWREELLPTLLGDTLANNHKQPDLALMPIQGI